MKHITRTIATYNTKVTFVMNDQLNEHILNGEVGKIKAKKDLVDIYGDKSIVVVSCKKEVAEIHLYRMPEEKFISLAEKVE